MALLAPVVWLALGMSVPLSGTVVDPAGWPVAGAAVWLGGTIATCKGLDILASAGTVERGEFRLERADDVVSRGGICSPALCAIVLLSHAAGTREVVGRVVDSVGKPVDGAVVYQSGDGPRQIQSTTDSDGWFRVPGVPDAPAFLFVDKAGYRFLGRRVDPGDRSIECVLRRLDEPSEAPLRPAALPVSRDEERAIARALIAEARKAPGDVHEVPERLQVPEVIALVDPDRMVAMIEDQVVTAEPGVLTALAVGRFEGDPRKALEILDAIGQPDTASFTTLGLFDRLGTTASPEFRNELLERAGRRARAIEEPAQAASQLARVADRWLDLGDADRGAKLVREALSMADEARVRAEKRRQQPVPNPRDDLALALARVDLPSALKLVEGRNQQQDQFDMVRAGVAKRVAASDPVGARRIIRLIHDPWQRRARRAVCLRMAAKDLQAARALAAEDHDPMVEALLPAVAARARAGSDPDRARALLLESVERLGKLGDSPAGGPSPAVALARLLPLAIRIDPDRAPGYFWLALSQRPPLSALPEPIPVTPEVRRHSLDLAELAVLVARYDRSVAEAVFAPVAARLVGMDNEPQGLGDEGPALFRAAGAFDGRVARSLLDALPEDPATPVGRTGRTLYFRHHSKAQARIALARILGLPPGLRLRELLMPHAGDDWLEELDD